jgi:hypothetical protein
MIGFVQWCLSLIFFLKKVFLKDFKFFLFYLFQNNIFLVFSNHFNMLILKIIFKNKKNIILILFWIKIILKNNHNYILKHILNGVWIGETQPHFLDIVFSVSQQLNIVFHDDGCVRDVIMIIF